MLEIHRAALRSRSSCYHEFLTRYAKARRVVYGFVEGKDDPCFYRGFIESKLPEDWEVELWPAGSKDMVYRVHSMIDWRRFPKRRVCFFVDRDLSDLIPSTYKTDLNIYITDSYSIENDIAKRGTCRRILTEVCGFSKARHDELDRVCDLYDQQLEIFLQETIPIMAWVLAWRREKRNANLSNILMQDLFSMAAGVIQVNTAPRGMPNSALYIHDRCGLVHDPGYDTSHLEAELRFGSVYRTVARGKYVFWFLVKFCRSIHFSAALFFSSCSSPPRMGVTLSPSNGIAIIGHRARLPESLRLFLELTYCDFIARRAA
jgi:hypothetical protein